MRLISPEMNWSRRRDEADEEDDELRVPRRAATLALRTAPVHARPRARSGPIRPRAGPSASRMSRATTSPAARGPRSPRMVPVTSRSKPSREASRRRRSARTAARSRPDSATSPASTVPSRTGRSRRLEASAMATARSAAGSSMRRPPATLTYTSCPDEVEAGVAGQDGDEHEHPIRVDPGRRPARRAVAGRRGQRLDLDRKWPGALERNRDRRAGRRRLLGLEEEAALRRRPRRGRRRASRARRPRRSSRSGS